MDTELEIYRKLASHEITLEAAKMMLQKKSCATDNTAEFGKVKKILVDMLHVEEQEITKSSKFSDLGVDSINGIEIIREVNQTFGTNLDAASIYDYPCLSDFVDFLSQLVDKSQDVAIKKNEAKAVNWNEDETVEKNGDVAGKVEKVEKKVTQSSSSIPPKMEEVLFEIIAHEMHMEKSELSSNMTFQELGIDSISGVELIRDINEKFGTCIDVSSIYDYPQIKEFLKFLEGTMSKDVRAVFKEESKPEPESVSVPKEEPIIEPIRDSEPGYHMGQMIGKQKLVITATANRSVPSKKEGKIVLSNKIHMEKATQAESKTSTNTLESKIKLTEKAVPTKEVKNEENQDIAIIGISGRYPEANSIDELWENDCNGKNCISDISERRWKGIETWKGFDQKKVEWKGCKGGVISDVDKFDPLFFHISPVEAELMDPQIRIMLEETWKAFEDAGYGDNQKQRKCGVFIGAAYSDYSTIMNQYGLDNTVYSFNGLNVFTISGYIAHVLNLSGPNMTLDTACSSALVAAHEACQCLRNHESDMAVAGGVRVLLTPNLYARTALIDMKSPSGQCKSFDANGDGLVLSEGAGVILLKRYEDAKRDGDHIYAVIKGSAVNHNSTTKCITSLDQKAQEQVIEDVYKKYGIDPSHIDYIEANASGAVFGDALEANALTNVFEKYTSQKNYCAVATIKSMIGHTTMASGIAGIIHIVKAMEHQQIPYIHNLEQINKDIKQPSAVYINTEPREWKRSSTHNRMAAIDAFGAGGTNCHMVLEESPARKIDDTENSYLFPISCNRKDGIGTCIENLLAWLKSKRTEYSMKDISFTLTKGRSHFKYRKCFVAETKQELENILELALQDRDKLEESISFVSEECTEKEIALYAKQSVSFLSKAERKMQLQNAAYAYERGCTLEWQQVFEGEEAGRISLPTYPFLKNSLWVSNHYQIPKEESNAKELQTSFDLVNSSTLKQYQFETTLYKENPLLEDHKIQGKGILPGVCYLELAAQACRKLTGLQTVELRNVFWSHALEVEDKKKVVVALTQDEDSLFYQIESEEGNKKTVYNRGKFLLVEEPQEEIKLTPEDLDTEGFECKDGKEYYDKYIDRGLYLGDTFRTIQEIYIGKGRVVSRIEYKEQNAIDKEKYILFPSVMDAAMETVVGLVDSIQKDSNIYMPYSLKELHFYHPLESQGFVSVVRRDTKDDTIECDVKIVNVNGTILVSFVGLTLMPLSEGEAAEIENVEKEETNNQNDEEKEILMLLQKLKGRRK